MIVAFTTKPGQSLTHNIHRIFYFLLFFYQRENVFCMLKDKLQNSEGYSR